MLKIQQSLFWFCCFKKKAMCQEEKKKLKELVTLGKVTVNTSKNKCTWTICQTEFFDKTKIRKEKWYNFKTQFKMVFFF